MWDDFIELPSTYDKLPWYRRRWFVALTFFLFAPAMLLIAATGDIYALRSGRVYKHGPKGKRVLVMAACAFMFFCALLLRAKS